MPGYRLQFPIRVPDDVLVELGEFTGNFWSDSLAQEPFVIEAIRNCINPAPPAPQQPAAASAAGYQWKQVFLPEGTRLRASFGRQPYFATVVGAEIKSDGHAVSPSCFANLHGSGNRNAWRAVWLPAFKGARATTARSGPAAADGASIRAAPNRNPLTQRISSAARQWCSAQVQLWTQRPPQEAPCGETIFRKSVKNLILRRPC